MNALAELCAEDADFVVISGKHLRGRREIFTYHDSLHMTIFKDRELRAELRDTRFIRPDVAIGHIAFQGRASSGDPRRNTGAFATVVVDQTEGRWRIAAFHNSRLSGPAGGVLPLKRR